jgi:tRNA threonylcarbamoyladenosine biosynthesis protein TsaB
MNEEVVSLIMALGKLAEEIKASIDHFRVAGSTFELVAGPVRSLEGHGIEADRIQNHCLIVIPLDGNRAVSHHCVNTFDGIRAIPHDIPQTVDLPDVQIADILTHCLQGLEIGMDITDQRSFHASQPYGWSQKGTHAGGNADMERTYQKRGIERGRSPTVSTARQSSKCNLDHGKLATTKQIGTSGHSELLHFPQSPTTPSVGGSRCHPDGLRLGLFLRVLEAAIKLFLFLCAVHGRGQFKLMHILAIDTSRTPGSVALLEDKQLIQELALPSQGRTTQHLFPVLQSLLAEVGWQPREVDLLAVTLGPGSFTGLRIGITLAKIWTYATSCQLVALGTLDVLAAQAESDMPQLDVVLHAERGQFFQARYERADGGTGQPRPTSRDSREDAFKSFPAPNAEANGPAWGFWRRVSPTVVVHQADWLRHLAPGSAVTGDGLAKIREPLPEGIVVESESNWILRAGTVGRLAVDSLKRGEQVDAWSLLPQYGRPSAAEEKRLQDRLAN